MLLVGQGPKSSQSAAKASPANPPQKPTAYRPPHAKQAAAAKAEVKSSTLALFWYYQLIKFSTLSMIQPKWLL